MKTEDELLKNFLFIIIIIIIIIIVLQDLTELNITLCEVCELPV